MVNQSITVTLFLAWVMSSCFVTSVYAQNQNAAPDVPISQSKEFKALIELSQPPRPVRTALLFVGHGTTLTQFKSLLRWYVSLRTRANARRLLLELIAKDDEKLAEALVLFTHNLRQTLISDTAARTAFTHYVIHTKAKLATLPANEQYRLVENYRNKLGVTKLIEPAIPSLFENRPLEPGTQEESLKAMQWAGIRINQNRYGRDDVVPTSLFDFEHDAGGYRKTNAMWMAELAALAYRSEAIVRTQLQQWSYTTVEWISKEESDTQAFVASNDRQVVVSFRGTDSAKDIRVDLSSTHSPESGSGGEVHSGFKSALDDVWLSRIEPAVAKQLGDRKLFVGDRKLFVGGHSLGAALAQLAAWRLEKKGHRVTAVYAFGSPRLGDEAFTRAYNARLSSRTFLHVNHKDIVTRVPPTWLGFRHAAGQSMMEFPEAVGHKLIKLDQQKWEDFQDSQPAPNSVYMVDQQSERLALLEKQWGDVDEALKHTTRYLHGEPDPLDGLSYETEFDKGFLDDHGIYQYLFKMGCAVIDDEFNSLGVIIEDR